MKRSPQMAQMNADKRGVGCEEKPSFERGDPSLAAAGRDKIKEDI